MAERKIIAHEVHGETVDTEELKFETIREDWNEYRLEDGTIVRLKTVAARMFRVLDADNNPVYTDAGDPHVIVRYTNLISTSE